MAHTFAAAEVLTAANLGARINWSDWTAVSFTNSWVNYGSGYQEVQYRKIGDIVYLRGLMKSGTINTAAFTLPSGFRPPAQLVVIVNSNAAVGLLQIATTGVVTPNVGSNVSFQLDSLFSVTA